MQRYTDFGALRCKRNSFHQRGIREIAIGVMNYADITSIFSKIGVNCVVYLDGHRDNCEPYL